MGWPLSLFHLRLVLTAGVSAGVYLVLNERGALLSWSGAIIAAILGLVYSFGLFDELHFEEGVMEPLDFLYTRQVGSFKKIGRAFTDLFAQLHQKGTLSYGVYFDNPKEVSEENLRWWVGNHGTAKHGARLERFRNLQPLDVIRCTIAWDNPLAPIIGAIRVYPKMRAECAKRGVVMNIPIEVYDEASKTITYAQVIPTYLFCSNKFTALPPCSHWTTQSNLFDKMNAPLFLGVLDFALAYKLVSWPIFRLTLPATVKDPPALALPANLKLTVKRATYYTRSVSLNPCSEYRILGELGPVYRACGRCLQKSLHFLG
jgi:hypothetical protein